MLSGSGASVQYELTRNEYVDGIQGATARTRSTWVMALVGVAVIALGAVTSTPVVFAGAGMLLMQLLCMTVGPEIRGRKLWKRREPVTLTVTETHVSVVSPTLKGESTWSHFRRLDCAGDLFLLSYANFRGVLIIPRRAFASAEQADSFRDFVRRHLGARS